MRGHSLPTSATPPAGSRGPPTRCSPSHARAGHRRHGRRLRHRAAAALRSLPYAHAKVRRSGCPAGGRKRSSSISAASSRLPRGRRATGRMTSTMRDGDAPARLVPGLQRHRRAVRRARRDAAARPRIRARRRRPGAEPVAVLSYGLWQELGGDAVRSSASASRSTARRARSSA